MFVLYGIKVLHTKSVPIFGFVGVVAFAFDFAFFEEWAFTYQPVQLIDAGLFEIFILVFTPIVRRSFTFIFEPMACSQCISYW